jgi:hypothetical protein
MPYLYFSDEEHLAQWMKVEKDPKEFEKFSITTSTASPASRSISNAAAG